MKEEWKPITDYEDSHEVSNLGRVRSLNRVVMGGSRWGAHQERKKGKIIAQFTNRDGYKCVHIKKNKHQKEFKVHRLVALAFFGEPKTPNMEVNHIDGDKANNTVSNLEWVTHEDNIRHNFNVLGYDYTGRLGRAGRLIQCTDTGELFPSATEVARKYGGTQGGVWYALSRGNGSYYGKRYKYIYKGE